MQVSVSRRIGTSVFLLFLIGFAIYAARLGPDANWDLRNYHLYDSFALLHGKLGYDIAPAQIQTYLAPQLDMIGYALHNLLNRHPALLNSVMSIPTAVETCLTFLISCRFLPVSTPGRISLAMLVALIGATGAAGLPTIATSSTESVPGSLCLAGFLLILTARKGTRPAVRLAIAAFLLGGGAGLKLTSLPYCLGGAAAALLAPIEPRRRKWLSFLVFAVMGMLGVVLIALPWWLVLDARFHSPLFPFINQIFRSPDYLPLAMSDGRFFPHGTLQTLFYPFYWAVSTTPRVTELPMRDPRFAVAFVMVILAALGILAKHGRNRAEAAMFLAFFIVSYGLWEKAFSIFRYLAPLEMLSATTVLVAWRVADPEGRMRWLPWIGTACLALLCLVSTHYPDWGRAPTGPKAVNVVVPRLPEDALVILLDSSPMAYVAAFEPPDVRFVGANSNLLSPGQKTKLEAEAEQVIRSAKGPVWGLEYFPAAAGMDDATLKYYGLHRVPPSTPVISNLDSSSLRLCPLVRDR